ncbi:hypothetical protein OG21DRAFT_1508055, partial [Imleria badia]
MEHLPPHGLSVAVGDFSGMPIAYLRAMTSPRNFTQFNWFRCKLGLRPGTKRQRRRLTPKNQGCFRACFDLRSDQSSKYIRSTFHMRSRSPCDTRIQITMRTNTDVGRPRKFDIRYSGVLVNEKAVVLSLGRTRMDVGGVLLCSSATFLRKHVWSDNGGCGFLFRIAGRADDSAG